MTVQHDDASAPDSVEEVLREWRTASAAAGDGAGGDDFWGSDDDRRWWRPEDGPWRGLPRIARVLLVVGIVLTGGALVALGLRVAAPPATDAEAAPATDAEAVPAPGPESESAPEPGPAAPGSTSPDWLSILRSVDRTRLMAWQAHDPALLKAVFAADGPAFRAESAVITGMAGDGVRVTGWRTTIRGVTELPPRGKDRVIAVTDRRGPYQWRRDGGRWQEVPAAGTRFWRVTMRALADVWLVWSVSEMAP